MNVSDSDARQQNSFSGCAFLSHASLLETVLVHCCCPNALGFGTGFCAEALWCWAARTPCPIQSGHPEALHHRPDNRRSCSCLSRSSPEAQEESSSWINSVRYIVVVHILDDSSNARSVSFLVLVLFFLGGREGWRVKMSKSAVKVRENGFYNSYKKGFCLITQLLSWPKVSKSHCVISQEPFLYSVRTLSSQHRQFLWKAQEPSLLSGWRENRQTLVTNQGMSWVKDRQGTPD